MLIVLLSLVLILPILFTVEPTNLTKSFSQICEKHDQTSINVANVFDFIGQFSNYVAIDKIKWLYTFAEYTTQKYITKPQSMSMS